MSTQTVSPTPIPAWVAAALTLLTLPMAAYPYFVSVNLKGSQSRSKQSAGGTRLLRFPPSMQRAVWALSIVAHLGLTLFAVVTALETECLGRPADFGYAELDVPCPKHQIRRSFTLLEVMLAPVYPTAIFLLYNSLEPTLSRKAWKRNFSRALVACITCTTLLLLLTCVGGVMLVTTRPDSDPTAINPLVFLYQRWYMPIFNLWFISMVILGVISLYLTIQLLPCLQHHKSNSSTQPQCTASIASFTPALSRAAVEVHGSTRHSEPTPQSGHPHLPISASIESNASHFPMVAAPNAHTASCERLDASIRRLKVFLLTVLIVLVGNAGMVAFRPFPFVLHVVIGWMSCRAVSVLLFAATREIKKAVLTRSGGDAGSSAPSGNKASKGRLQKGHSAGQRSADIQE